MSRRKLTTALTVVLTALMMPSIQAEDRGYAPNAAPPMLLPPPLMDRPTAITSEQGAPNYGAYRQVSNPVPTTIAPTPIEANRAEAAAVPPNAMPQQGYVRLGAPMYPTPRPNIPIWTGSTVITNQAFAPQEMLYPHTYRAIYPPFYHRVKGGWILTPLGVRSHERWELQGTTVQVKYRSSYPGLMSGAFWHPPATLNSHGQWR